VIVTQCEIRAAKRVVKQFPFEVLQQSSNASSCMQMRIVVEEQYEYTRYQHSTPFVMNEFISFVFYNTPLTLSWSLVACVPPSALLSCPREQFLSAFCQTTFV
jgi:hypothetical protein